MGYSTRLIEVLSQPKTIVSLEQLVQENEWKEGHLVLDR